METGHSSDQLAGNAPIIVDRSDGSVHVMGTAKPLQHYIAAYEASKRPAHEACPACGRILDGRMDLALTLREEGDQTAKVCKQVFHCSACGRRSWRWNDRQTENLQLVAR